VEKLKVKGSSIRSKQAFVCERFGEDAEAEFQSFLTSRGVGLVLDADWYDFEIFDDALRHIAERHFRGDLERLRDVGRHSARVSLTGVYAAFLRPGGDFIAFLERLATLHGRYYSLGGLEVRSASREAKKVELRLFGAPSYSEPDLQVAAGFYCGVAEMLGLERIRCDFEIRADSAFFKLVWS
jgi:hypothetical protein